MRAKFLAVVWLLASMTTQMAMASHPAELHNKAALVGFLQRALDEVRAKSGHASLVPKIGGQVGEVVVLNTDGAKSLFLAAYGGFIFRFDESRNLLDISWQVTEQSTPKRRNITTLVISVRNQQGTWKIASCSNSDTKSEWQPGAGANRYELTGWRIDRFARVAADNWMASIDHEILEEVSAAPN